MARNRMIKPDFFDDQKLPAASRDARLTYIGMWIQSDDFGVVRGNPTWLRSKIYPHEQISLPVFRKWLSELEKIRRIMPFKWTGELYYYIPTFLTHQKVDRPNVTHRNPAPPKDLIDSSQNHRGLFDESSAMHRTERKGKEEKGKGKERKGKEVKGGEEVETLPPELNELPMFLVDEKLIRNWPDLLISWKKTYPQLDIMSHIQRAHNYLVEHPEKHYRNMIKYISSWLKRSVQFQEQDKLEGTLRKDAKKLRMDERVKRLKESMG